MRYFNYLDRISLFLVLIIGLGGCVRSENTEKNAGKPAWGLPEPIILHANGAQTPFHQLNLTSQELGMDDQLFFSKLDPNVPGVRFSVESRCIYDTKELGPYITAIPMKNIYEFYQFVPAELFSLPEQLTSKPICHFKFIATNSEGSTHQFDLNKIAISTKVVKPSLQLLELMQFEKVDGQLVINASEFHQILIHSDLEKTTYVLPYCSNIENTSTELTNVLTLKEVFQNSKQLQEESVHRCRIAGLSSSKHIIELSPQFFVRFNNKKPTVQYSLAWDSTSNIHQPLKMVQTPKGARLGSDLGSIFFYNNMPTSIFLRFNNDTNHQLHSDLIYSRVLAPPKTYSQKFPMHLHWYFAQNNRPLESIENGRYALLEIPANTSIEVKLKGFWLLKRCARDGKVLGIRISSKREQGVSLFDQVENKDGSMIPTGQGPTLSEFIFTNYLNGNDHSISIEDSENGICR